MAHNDPYNNQNRQNQAGWDAAALRGPPGAESGPSGTVSPRTFGQAREAEVGSWGPTPGSRNTELPQEVIFDANAYAQQGPSTLNFAPRWSSQTPVYGYEVRSGSAYGERGQSIPPTQPYAQPNPPSQSQNQPLVHSQPTVPSQPYGPYHGQLNPPPQSQAQPIVHSQPTVPSQPYSSYHPSAPPVPLSLPQPAVHSQPQFVQQTAPPHVFASHPLGTSSQNQPFRGVPDPGYQAPAGSSTAHMMQWQGSAHQGTRPVPHGTHPVPHATHPVTNGAQPLHPRQDAGAAGSNVTNVTGPQAHKSKRVRCEEVEDEEAPVKSSTQQARPPRRAQIFNDDPRRQNDILREQAVQDAIRHLAKPRAAPDTSQADRANAREQPASPTQGAAVEDDDDNDAGDEGEDDADLPQKSRPRRKNRAKRRKIATPEADGPGDQGNDDDDDDDDAPPQPSPPEPRPLPKWDQTVPCTIPAGRKSRTKPRVRLTRFVRKTLLTLLNRPTRTSPLPPLPADDVRYPTLDKYSIRFDQSETSIFNQMAANIAALKIRRDYPGKLTKSMADGIADMVTSHIRYLCRCYKSELKDDANELRAVRLKRASANSRAHTLYESRLKIIDRFPNELGKHRALIVHLGIEGTSSDEEEPGPPEQRSYRVKRRVELSSKVKKLKNKLDMAYNIWYKGRGSKGSPMHLRRPSDKLSDRPFMIEGLPITCISRSWYRSLSKPKRGFYQFVPHDYDFSFPDELLRRPDVGMEIDPESSQGEYTSDEGHEDDDDEGDDDEGEGEGDGDEDMSGGGGGDEGANRDDEGDDKGKGDDDEDMSGEAGRNQGANRASGSHA
ncbi:hypothetical protein FRC12_023932 [Ceratobasidium sp. 428]|nr:hypothetical protein FRC12_023932 [Ceratobasidium sp. 428]